MVLNKTNAGILAAAFGKNPGDWVNQRIEIYSEMTGLGKPGLRIRVLRTEKSIQDDMGDEIPSTCAARPSAHERRHAEAYDTGDEIPF
jgi:hypothetical protein